MIFSRSKGEGRAAESCGGEKAFLSVGEERTSMKSLKGELKGMGAVSRKDEEKTRVPLVEPDH